MHDDTNTTEESGQSQAAATVEVKHCYYEIPNDLLSKPNALSDIIEHEGLPATVVFCNSPSDTDLVEVMLKKRGIPAAKLIGHVNPAKVISAVREAREGKITVLVVTDVAARNIEVEDLDLVVNYSVPTDPEVYIHRTGRTSNCGRLHKIISLVSPLDIGSFHYIKKFVSLPFHKEELPSKDSMNEIRFKNLCASALKNPAAGDEGMLTLARSILGNSEKEGIVAFLLNNTLNVMPAMKAAAEREQQQAATYSDSDEEFGDQAERPAGEERTDRGDRGGGRGDRGDRGGGYGGRGGGRGDRGGGGRGGGDRGGRGGRGRDRGYGAYEGERPSEGQQPAGDFEEGENPRFRRGGRNDRNGRDRQPMPPPQRDIRIYLGQGARQGFSEQKFRDLVSQHCPIPEEKIKRFNQRECYAFVDIAEELADSVVEKLDNADVGGADKLLVRKATVITAQREGGPPRGEDADSAASADANGNFGAEEGLEEPANGEV